MKIIITTYPFESADELLSKLVKEHNANITFNNKKRRYTIEEHIEVLKKMQPDIIIAGTEKYDKEILDLIPNLKMISRVGIGIDSVDLEECKRRGIIVTNTPDAPSNAVAELVIGQMINMLRKIQQVSDIKVWNRFKGRELRNCDIGIIGIGRIGNLVIEKLHGLKPKRILINDIVKTKCINKLGCEYATKSKILSECDIVTIHIPLNDDNYNFIKKEDLDIMKEDGCIINMSRGGIINENDLYYWLKNHPNASASIDTFECEPYMGKLETLNNMFFTPHLGSMTKYSRFMMETGATEEIINFLTIKEFNNRVY